MKAGTTWLHDYLAASPQCQPGHRKEYHVFDSLDFPAEQGKEPWLLHRVVDKARGSLDDVAQGRPTDPTFLHQAAMIADEQLYFDYFTALFSRDPAHPAHPRHHARLRAAVDRPAGLDPRRVRAAVGAAGGGVPAARPGRADLVAGADAEAAAAGEQPRLRRGAGGAAVRRAVVRRADPLRGDGPPPRRGVRRPGRLRVLRGAVRPGHHRAGAAVAVRAGRDRLPRARPRRAVQRLTALGARCPRRRCGRWPSTTGPTYEFVASRFPDRDLPRIWPSARFVL